MTTPTGPNHFDPRNVFMGTKWNVFMVVASLLCLWLAAAALGNAYRTAGWWPDAAWAFVIVVNAHSAWVSAVRLWRAHKSVATSL